MAVFVKSQLSQDGLEMVANISKNIIIGRNNDCKEQEAYNFTANQEKLIDFNGYIIFYGGSGTIWLNGNQIFSGYQYGVTLPVKIGDRVLSNIANTAYKLAFIKQDGVTPDTGIDTELKYSSEDPVENQVIAKHTLNNRYLKVYHEELPTTWNKENALKGNEELHYVGDRALLEETNTIYEITSLSDTHVTWTKIVQLANDHAVISGYDLLDTYELDPANFTGFVIGENIVVNGQSFNTSTVPVNKGDNVTGNISSAFGIIVRDYEQDFTYGDYPDYDACNFKIVEKVVGFGSHGEYIWRRPIKVSSKSRNIFEDRSSVTSYVANSYWADSWWTPTSMYSPKRLDRYSYYNFYKNLANSSIWNAGANTLGPYSNEGGYLYGADENIYSVRHANYFNVGDAIVDEYSKVVGISLPLDILKDGWIVPYDGMLHLNCSANTTGMQFRINHKLIFRYGGSQYDINTNEDCTYIAARDIPVKKGDFIKSNYTFSVLSLLAWEMPGCDLEYVSVFDGMRWYDGSVRTKVSTFLEYSGTAARPIVYTAKKAEEFFFLHSGSNLNTLTTYYIDINQRTEDGVVTQDIRYDYTNPPPTFIHLNPGDVVTMIGFQIQRLGHTVEPMKYEAGDVRVRDYRPKQWIQQYGEEGTEQGIGKYGDIEFGKEYDTGRKFLGRKVYSQLINPMYKDWWGVTAWVNAYVGCAGQDQEKGITIIYHQAWSVAYGYGNYDKSCTYDSMSFTMVMNKDDGNIMKYNWGQLYNHQKYMYIEYIKNYDTFDAEAQAVKDARAAEKGA